MQSQTTQERNKETTSPVTSLSLRGLLWHGFCDRVSGYLLISMLIFSPWAFGTTQPWSIWVMNCLGYLLGILLALKLVIRITTGYQSPRWEVPDIEKLKSRFNPHVLTRILAILTIVTLGFCLISALNPRSTYLPRQLSFVYHKHIPWLPHSYDSTSSWQAFWTYLAIALSFWACRDWILGKSVGEQLAERGKLQDPSRQRTSFLPERLRTLLWVLSINGALLAVEGIVQRLANSGELLFLVRPRIHTTAIGQFGPYAYRSNAAQYFNMVWPATLALWWMLQKGRNARIQAGKSRLSHHVLLACVSLMAICPILSASRAGAAVTIISMVLAGGILWSAQRKGDKKSKRFILAFSTIIVGVGLWLGWNDLMPRLQSYSVEGSFAIRNNLYAIARPMAEQHAVFGTGPGTFAHLFQLYRPVIEEEWPAQLHNDWLETRITFGLIGMGLILASLGIVLVRWFFPGGIHGGRRMVMLLWISLAGCLAHARYDFPFQIYSTLFLFVILCAMLFCLSYKTSR